MVKAVELTARQAQVLGFVRDYVHAHGMPPTRGEIAKALGFRSANAAEQHLRALARKAVLRLLPGTARGICLDIAEPEPDRMGGRRPPPVRDESVNALTWLQDPGQTLLCYEGAPLRSLGILPGDCLVLAPCTEPVHDQLVLVSLGGQRSVKRFRRKGKRAYLISDATDSAAFVVSERVQAAIEAVVLGVVRRYEAVAGPEAR
ncbi:MAG: repressor LexA [Gammaproteobacteria bacterium]|nr:repressor LexA [Gammaproteobacteria bacterium]